MKNFQRHIRHAFSAALIAACFAFAPSHAGAQESVPTLPELKAPSLNSPAMQTKNVEGEAVAKPKIEAPKIAAPKAAPQIAVPEGAANASAPPRAPELSVSGQSLTPPSLPGAQGAPAGAPGTAVQVVRKSEAEIRQDAFNAALRGLMPLEPEEIRKLLEHFDATRQAVEIPVHPYPEPEVAVRTVPLDPGVKPQVINVGTGHVSTLGIFDITGAPWPIRDMTWAGNFELVQPEPGGHIIRITPLTDFAYGNISVRLLDLNTPITFTMKTARDKVHYRFDARIPEFGPHSNIPLVQGGSQIAAGDATLAGILEGVPPMDSERLEVSGVDGRTSAYRVAETTYLRTPFTLLSPGWASSVSSADGMSVYELGNAPVVLLSDNGQVVRAHLKSKDYLQ